MIQDLNIKEFAQEIQQHNIAFLSKAITLAESKKTDHQAFAQRLIQELYWLTGKSKRIAVTGVPGVGKSTFVDRFGCFLIEKGHRVAVLAIDPSSSLTGGSILGDKTRMETLSKSNKAFIRPSATSGSLGGITSRTHEAILLCEAAGFDIVLIETVGVGQSEVLVKDITDCFLYLKVIGTGDALQGIKRGITEMADLVFINKEDDADPIKIKTNKTELERSLHLMQAKKSGWQVKVLQGSGLEMLGFDMLWQQIEAYFILIDENGFLQQNRQSQHNKRIDFYTQEMIHDWVRQHIKQPNISNNSNKTPYQIAKDLVGAWLPKKD